jgi:hypothetical protein
MRMVTGWIFVAWLLGGAAAGHAPVFDPRVHRDFAGPPNQVLVLGTPHLASLPPAFTAQSLGPVLDRLARWKPDIITIEGLSGPECEMLKRYKSLYEDAYESYCWDPRPAQGATGLSVPDATAEVERLLHNWPVAPGPADRRHLAAVFMAAGDRASALVQWLRLPPPERQEGDGLDAALAATLRKVEAGRNENYILAAALAARLGLERVFPADDHSADSIQAGLGSDFEAAMRRIWNAAGPRKAALAAQEAKLGSPQATLDYYRYHNRPEAAADAFTYDFGAALKDATPQRFGRRYVGWWETRNLRMVANIRAAFAPHPGARVLAIVGSSHKGYFEAYLSMMHDVTLADAEAVLR